MQNSFGNNSYKNQQENMNLNGNTFQSLGNQNNEPDTANVRQLLQATEIDAMPKQIHLGQQALKNQIGQKGFQSLLNQVQPSAPDIITGGSTNVNESSFLYNSDDESQVHEILQQSNRLMERRENGEKPDFGTITLGQMNEEERMKELQRQKLELLSLQHPNQESLGYDQESELVQVRGQHLTSANLPASFLNDTSIRGDITSQQQIFSREEEISQMYQQQKNQNFNVSNQAKGNPLDETDTYPRGRVRNLIPETEETMLEGTANHQRRRNEVIMDQDAPLQTRQPGPNRNLQIIGADGQPQDKSKGDYPVPQHEVDHHLNMMYIREKPLLEKIKAMREDFESLQAKMKAVQAENDQLKSQLKVYQGDQQGDARLKQHIQMLQDEVQYLTQINNAQSERINDFQSERGRTTAKSKSRTRQASKSATKRVTRKSQIRADTERSRSGFLRDCCVMKHEAIHAENCAQQKRIQEKNRKYSPMSSTARLSEHSTITSAYKNTFEDHASFSKNVSTAQLSMRSDNSRVKRKASRTPTRAGDSKTPKNYQREHHSSMQFDPLPTPPMFNQGRVVDKNGNLIQDYNTATTGQF